MTKLSLTQKLHKLTEDNLRIEDLYNYIKENFSCDVNFVREKEMYGDLSGHEVVYLHIKNFNGLCALTGTSEYNYTNCIGALAVDFKKCFNKWSQVPIRISLERSNEEIVDLMKKYNTKANLKVSDSFGKIFWDE